MKANQSLSTEAINTKYNDMRAVVERSGSHTVQLAKKIHQTIDRHGSRSREFHAIVHDKLDALDARMTAIQGQLRKSAIHPFSKPQKTPLPQAHRVHPGSGSHHRVSARVARIELIGLGRCLEGRPSARSEEYLRVVRPALVSQMAGHEEQIQLWPLEDTRLHELPGAKRKAIVQYLQGLRLFIWLFQKDNYMLSRNKSHVEDGCHKLCREGGIHLIWERELMIDIVFPLTCFCQPSAITDFNISFPEPAISLSIHDTAISCPTSNLHPSRLRYLLKCLSERQLDWKNDGKIESPTHWFSRW